MSDLFWTMTVNIPGCLPEADKVIYYRSAEKALEAAIDDRRTHFADLEMDDSDDAALAQMRHLIEYTKVKPLSVYFGPTIYGSTPGYDHSEPEHDHDLGLVYSIAPITFKDFLSGFTFAQFVHAYKDHFEALEEDGSFDGLTFDGANDLLDVVALKYSMHEARIEYLRTVGPVDAADPATYDMTLDVVWPFVGRFDHFDDEEGIEQALVDLLWEETY